MIEGSYDISRFAVDVQGEVKRLNAQVDLFWNQEIALYQQLGLADGMKVLDCGCGPGYLLTKLHALYASMQCIGIEISPELVAVARARTASGKPGRCQIFQQSIAELEFPDGSFDFVIARLVLEHLPNPMPALKEVLRVLKPGGKAIFVDNDFDLHERTWPDCPALEELYAAYRRARRADGGNPCIGRELPLLMKNAGYDAVDLHVLTAHNQVTGDALFLKAEGSGIPAQLVKAGYLEAESLDRIADQWRSMLRSPDHAIVRFLFAASGGKADKSQTGIASDISKSLDRRIFTNGAASALSKPQSRDEVRRFIQNSLAAEMNLDAALLATGKSLIHLGVDSLPALGLCNKLQSQLGVSLNMADVLGGKTIDELADQILPAMLRSCETAVTAG
jgi:SAM-dependent methyltransferase/acyl carrier protein